MRQKQESWFDNYYDFKLAQKWPNEAVYMGSFFGRFGKLQRALTKLDVVDEKSYFNLPNAKNIFCPEAPYRSSIDGGKWSYKKNQAFWAGAIKAKREFLLLSPLHLYEKKIIKGQGDGTISELLWLSDNDYIFEAKNHLLIAKPPAYEITNPIIYDYAYMRTDNKLLRQAIKKFLQKVPSELLDLSSNAEINLSSNMNEETPKPNLNWYSCNIL
ncbi:hypothetical protein ACQUW5_13915 [Legionella sp. CNM-1927-20]|uniref:hypothetical protein n=1 Tax=Legionella sp. CNM-1927-20 TaxID=3422221 RepID=UPI00403AA8AB